MCFPEFRFLCLFQSFIRHTILGTPPLPPSPPGPSAGAPHDMACNAMACHALPCHTLLCHGQLHSLCQNGGCRLGKGTNEQTRNNHIYIYIYICIHMSMSIYIYIYIYIYRGRAIPSKRVPSMWHVLGSFSNRLNQQCLFEPGLLFLRERGLFSNLIFVP